MRGSKLGPTKAASPVPISSLAQSISRMSEFAQNCRWTPDYGISSKHAAHSAHWFSPPAGTTRIAAIVRSASPHLRQIIRSPAWPARAQYSAIEAGSSISSTRIKLRSVSKQPPSQFPPKETLATRDRKRNCPRAAGRSPPRHPPPISAAALSIEHDAQSIPPIWKLARPVAVPGESRNFRAPGGPDARWFAAARPRPDWRYPYG